MRGAIRGLTYAVLIAGVVYSLVSAIALLRDAREDVTRAHAWAREDSVWYANQFQLELSDLLDAIDSYRADAGGGTAEGIIERFDVLWSRLAYADRGALGAAYMRLEGASEIVAAARSVLDELDPILSDPSRADDDALRRSVDRLRGLRLPFKELSIQTVVRRQHESAANFERQVAYASRIELLLIGLLVFSTGTALVLVIDRSRLAAVKTDLERRFRDSTRELEESEQRYRLIVENAPEAIVVLDVDKGSFVDVNDNACAMFKLAREALLERGPEQLSPPLQPDCRPSSEAAREYIMRAVEGEALAFDWVHADAEGKELECEIRIVRMPSAQAVLVRGSIVDVTERRAVEHELARYRNRLEALVEERTDELMTAQQELMRSERLAAIGELIGTVSHELRNPLGTVSASFDVLRRRLGDLDESTVRVLERIERNIARCVLIISELLDYARMRELSCSQVDVDRWLSHLVGETEVSPGVRLTHRLGAGVEANLDPDRARQAMVNLLQNAAQALAEGDAHGGEICVSSRVRGDWVEIAVADDGPGIAPEVRDRIFEPLFSTRPFGVGLGLPLVRRIVEQHGGELVVESTPGAGARFTIRLPVAEAA